MSRNSMPLSRSRSTVREDVAGGERDVLAAGAVVELEVLVDLRLLLRDRRLVERELHPVVAARDDLRHQRGVVGGDVVADELRHVREAHDLVVELHPLVHPAELDVADAVVDGLEEPLRVALAPRHLGGGGDVAGEEGAVVARAVDEGVARLAVRRDGGDPDRAVLVGHVVRARRGSWRPWRGRGRCTGRRRAPRWRCRRRRRRGARWWSSSGLVGVTPPVKTKRALPERRT